MTQRMIDMLDDIKHRALQDRKRSSRHPTSIVNNLSSRPQRRCRLKRQRNVNSSPSEDESNADFSLRSKTIAVEKETTDQSPENEVQFDPSKPSTSVAHNEGRKSKRTKENKSMEMLSVSGKIEEKIQSETPLRRHSSRVSKPAYCLQANNDENDDDIIIKPQQLKRLVRSPPQYNHKDSDDEFISSKPSSNRSRSTQLNEEQLTTGRSTRSIILKHKETDQTGKINFFHSLNLKKIVQSSCAKMLNVSGSCNDEGAHDRKSKYYTIQNLRTKQKINYTEHGGSNDDNGDHHDAEENESRSFSTVKVPYQHQKSQQNDKNNERKVNKNVSFDDHSLGERSRIDCIQPFNWKLQCKIFLQMMCLSEDNKPFKEPISSNKYPDYGQIVDVPVYLSSIQENLYEENYNTPLEFYEDVRRVFENANIHSKIYQKLGRMTQEMVKILHNWKRSSSRCPKTIIIKRQQKPKVKPSSQYHKKGSGVQCLSTKPSSCRRQSTRFHDQNNSEKQQPTSLRTKRPCRSKTIPIKEETTDESSEEEIQFYPNKPSTSFAHNEGTRSKRIKENKSMDVLSVSCKIKDETPLQRHSSRVCKPANRLQANNDESDGDTIIEPQQLKQLVTSPPQYYDKDSDDECLSKISSSCRRQSTRFRVKNDSEKQKPTSLGTKRPRRSKTIPIKEETTDESSEEEIQFYPNKPSTSFAHNEGTRSKRIKENKSMDVLSVSCKIKDETPLRRHSSRVCKPAYCLQANNDENDDDSIIEPQQLKQLVTSPPQCYEKDSDVEHLSTDPFSNKKLPKSKSFEGENEDKSDAHFNLRPKSSCRTKEKVQSDDEISESFEVPPFTNRRKSIRVRDEKTDQKGTRNLRKKKRNYAEILDVSGKSSEEDVDNWKPTHLRKKKKRNYSELSDQSIDSGSDEHDNVHDDFDNNSNNSNDKENNERC